MLTVVAILAGCVFAAGFAWLGDRVAERVRCETTSAGGPLIVLIYGMGALIAGVLFGYYAL